jgi:RHS repeat-associated protein
MSIIRKYDAFGEITGETHYDASGAVVTSAQAGYVDEAFAFTGRWLDAETGLQNNLNRWYDGGIGRWISEDPIGFAGGDPNLYRYVGNEPTTTVDPSGLLVGPGPWFAARAAKKPLEPGDPLYHGPLDDGPIYPTSSPFDFFAGFGAGVLRGAGGGTARAVVGAAGQAGDDAGLAAARSAWKSVGPEQRKLISEWMGVGPQGARNAMGRGAPRGLVDDTLRKYEDLARRLVNAGNDPLGTQQQRLRLIEEALRSRRQM